MKPSASLLCCVNDYERFKQTEREYKRLARGDIETVYFYNENNDSIAKVYNRLIEWASSDTLVFSHQDAYPLEEGWDEKIISYLNYLNGGVGIVGFAGSDAFPTTGMWWAHPRRYGHLSQGGSPLDFEGELPHEVRVLDGFAFGCKKKICQEISFDERYPSVHLVVEDFCLEAGKRFSVLVIPLLFMHLSPGDTGNEMWRKSYQIFREKWEVEFK